MTYEYAGSPRGPYVAVYVPDGGRFGHGEALVQHTNGDTVISIPFVHEDPGHPLTVDAAQTVIWWANELSRLYGE